MLMVPSWAMASEIPLGSAPASAGRTVRDQGPAESSR